MTRDEFVDYLASFGVFSQPAEGRDYVEYHWTRFHRTLEEIPDSTGKLLEIGAAPFCMTLLLLAQRRFELSCVNYGSAASIVLESAERHLRYEVPCAGINVECEVFPYHDDSFDVVLCAEVIEHLTFYPSWMLYEVHRILKPSGFLVLTTPNAMRLFYRLSNARNAFAGRHIADPFSGYGPYGRHNRELTPDELRLLVEGTGFSIASFEVLDLEPRWMTWGDRKWARIVSKMFGISGQQQEAWRGAQMIVKAQPDRPRVLATPEELYKSVHALPAAQHSFPRIP